MNEIWTEKFRPKNLSEIVGQKENIEKLKGFVRAKDVPHLIFSGPAGTGKTTAAMALAIELYGESWKENFLELNASNNRGINVIRGHEDREGKDTGLVSVKDYARLKPSNDLGFKLIFLDEADQLTGDAQAALRRTMEVYSSSTRFILSCNYSSQIIPPIQSRCVIMRFRSLEESAIKERIRQISSQEKLSLSNEIVDAIAEVAEGDMRKAINVMQTMASSGDITEKRVYEMFGYSSSEEFASLVSAALEHGLFDEAREKLDELMIKMGVSGIDILRGMHSVVRRHRMPGKEKLEVIIALAEAEYRIVEGGSDNIQLDALLARLVKIGSEFS